MHIVYILKSKKNIDQPWYYVGMTQNIEKRLSQHNAGATKSTKSHCPFMVIYTKEFQTRTLARDYEKFLKIRSNKEKALRELGEL